MGQISYTSWVTVLYKERSGHGANKGCRSGYYCMRMKGFVFYFCRQSSRGVWSTYPQALCQQISDTPSAGQGVPQIHMSPDENLPHWFRNLVKDKWNAHSLWKAIRPAMEFSGETHRCCCSGCDGVFPRWVIWGLAVEKESCWFIGWISLEWNNQSVG